ncbi:MAG TPA: hypothetical protein VGF98_00925 [Candidatus Tumulicola sp.]
MKRRASPVGGVLLCAPAFDRVRSNQRDPFLNDLALVLELFHQQRLKQIVLALQLGILGGVEIESGMLRCNRRLLVWREVVVGRFRRRPRGGRDRANRQIGPFIRRSTE